MTDWTPELEQKSKELDAKATPGEWYVSEPLYSGADGGKHQYREISSRLTMFWVCRVLGFFKDSRGEYEANTQFIAHARTALPAAVREIEKLRENRDYWATCAKDAQHWRDHNSAEIEILNKEASVKDMEIERLRAENERLEIALIDYRNGDLLQSFASSNEELKAQCDELRTALERSKKLQDLTLTNEIRWMRKHDDLSQLLASLRDWKSPDGVLQVKDLQWAKALLDKEPAK